MSLERIRQAILTKARQEAEKIESEARVRREEELAAAGRSLQEEFEHHYQRASEDAQREGERQVVHRRYERNMELLRQRNALLDELFQRAARRLADCPDGRYREVVRGWMREIPPDAAGEVLCSERDAERLAPLIEDLNRSREADARLRLVPGERPAAGGVIFRTQSFEVDLSLDSRMARSREELTSKVAEILFQKDTAA